MFEIFTQFASFMTYSVLGMTEGGAFTKAVHFFFEGTTKIFFLLTVLMLIIGFFRSWISADKIQTWLEGKPKLIAYFLAVLLGAITPFCSCSSLPLFIAFLNAGIPLGVTMAFLITSPMVNEVAAVLFGEAIGWEFTLAYVAVGMGTGIIGGMLIDALKFDKWIEQTALAPSCGGCCGSTPDESLKGRFMMALNETIDMIKKVWLYILIGVGLGAGIHGYVPQEWFIENAGADNLFAVPMAVIMALPLYSNVSGTVPIADVLIQKGLPVGTTLAFIMSTVAVSLPELVILRRVMTVKLIAVFVAYLILAFIVVGYGFNAVY